MQFLQNEQLRYVQYDCANMNPEEKWTKVQQPLYEVYRQIYKGPNYDTPYFCNKKLEKTSPEVDMIECELCYNEANQVVGGATAKISTIKYKGDQYGILEGTSGFLEGYRGDNRGQIFMNIIQLKYFKKYPKNKFCYFDLLTSPSSYKSFNYLNHTYPRIGIVTPPHIQEFIDFLIHKTTSYKAINSSKVDKGCYILQGAKVRENPQTLYTRLTRGKGDKRLEFFYKQTGAINGIGLMGFIDSVSLGLEANHYVNARTQRTQNQVPPHILPQLLHSDLQYLIQLRENVHLYRGYTQSSMIPKMVSISLEENDIKFIQSELQKIGISNPEIKYMTKIPGLNYKDYTKILSQKEMTITFNHNNHPIFAAVIPKGEFNPFIGPIGSKFVELVLHDDINVRDKDVIDLGCGCGNIGMAAILMGATKVLFSDIVPEYLTHIKKYELMVSEEHEFVSQSLLDETVKNQDNAQKYDVIIMNTPTFSFFNIASIANQSVNNQNLLYGSSDFYQNLLRQSFIVLRNNGELFLWSLFANLSPETAISFFQCFRNNFDILNFQIICIEQQIRIGIFDVQETSPNNFYMIYKIKKVAKKPYSDFQFEVTISMGLMYLANYLLARGFHEKSKQFMEAFAARKNLLKQAKL